MAETRTAPLPWRGQGRECARRSGVPARRWASTRSGAGGRPSPYAVSSGCSSRQRPPPGGHADTRPVWPQAWPPARPIAPGGFSPAHPSAPSPLETPGPCQGGRSWRSRGGAGGQARWEARRRPGQQPWGWVSGRMKGQQEQKQRGQQKAWWGGPSWDSRCSRHPRAPPVPWGAGWAGPVEGYLEGVTAPA